MPAVNDIRDKLEEVFEEKQAKVLSVIITDAYQELVKTGDFNELKGIVKELAEAQKRTEVKVEDLAEAQKRTEVKVEDLAEAQKRTEVKIEDLAEAQRSTENEIRLLVKGLRETRGELGGLSRSVGYGFENEAYRMIPKLLKARYGIELKEKLIRAEVAGKEINLLGRAKRGGKDVLVVGEAKLRLDDRRKKKGDVFKELDEKLEAVKVEHEGEEIVSMLITHYATRGFLKKAEARGVIVIQSFE